MIVILSIRPCDSGDGVKLAVESDGVKNTYTVSADFFLEKKIEKGSVAEDVLYDIIEEDKHYAARRAAVRILASGQCSAKKLYDKLRMRGFPHECAKNAADFALKNGYINEEWQIENYLRTLIEKKYVGRRKVVLMLLAKGYSAERVTKVLDENYTEDDFKEAKKNFLLAKFGKTTPDSFEEAEQIKKALYKQGY